LWRAQVLALTYMLEVERHGSEHIRTAPAQVRRRARG
jgi:hypothetical protein